MNANEIREKQKLEALKRLNELKVHPNVIEDFKVGKLNRSEFGGILYWLNDDEKEVVDQFEEKTNCLVYHAIKNPTEFGELLTLLYVSEYEEEWEQEMADLSELCEFADGQKGYVVMAYVKNLDDDMCSEFGSVGIMPNYGGVKRIA